MRKRSIPLLLIVAILLTVFTGCSPSIQGDGGESQPSQNIGQQAGNSGSSAKPEDESSATSTPQQDHTSTETPSDDGTPVVYMTTDISSGGLMAIYEALGASPSGSIAVKLSTGEPGSNYLRTDPIGELVQSLDATIVECNTAYGGSRANTAMHYQVAEDADQPRHQDHESWGAQNRAGNQKFFAVSAVCHGILVYNGNGCKYHRIKEETKCPRVHRS